mmetsp:Transcript_107974/g.207609  ORF Transcript_107974/g.207609 Transcript_107974/m.207609 type:complete len:308 (-) Transcript_107974:4-927(-)
MPRTAFLLACLTCFSHGWRGQSFIDQLQSSQKLSVSIDAGPRGNLSARGTPHNWQALAWLLLTSNPASMFNPCRSSSLQERSGARDSTLDGLHLTAFNRMGGTRRVNPMFASTTAVLERATPPPGAPPRGGGNGGGGGGGGGGEDDSLSLRLLTSDQQATVLNDWVSRTKIYCMAGEFGNRAIANLHKKALSTLQALQTFNTSGATFTKDLWRGESMFVGMFDTEETILAVAGAEVYGVSVSKKRGRKEPIPLMEVELLVSHLAVNPKELHTEDSTARLQMLMGLRYFAKSHGASIDLSEVENNVID